MKHYGDITKLSGYELPVVDVITGGSPCQDLSVAGKRAGLQGARSGLFMEQIRIIKEMRESDRQRGRSGADVRPRYCIWENVPGAFSSGSPKGADFAAVIEEFIKVGEQTDHVDVRIPDGGWPKCGCYWAEDGSWSLAWRLHDAQYWGVPQRRKRLSLLFDGGGLSAPWLLFDPQLERTAENGLPLSFVSDPGEEPRPEVQSQSESLRGNSDEGSEEGQGTPDGAEGGARVASYTLKVRGGVERDSSGRKAGKGALIQTELSGTLGVSQDQTLIQPCLNPWDVQSKHIQSPDGVAEALYSGECRYGGGESYVMAEGVVSKGNGECFTTGDKHTALATGGGQAGQGYPCVLTSDMCIAPKEPTMVEMSSTKNTIIEDGISCTLTARMGTGGNQVNAVCVDEPIVLESNQNHATVTKRGVCNALPASMGMGGGYTPMIVDALPFDTTQVTSDKNWSHPKYGDPCHPLAAGMHPPAVAFTQNQREEVRVLDDKAAGLAAESGSHQQTYVAYGLGSCNPSVEEKPKVVAYGISAYDSNAMKSPNPHSGIYEAYTSRTLDLNGGSPACNQGGIAIVEPIPIEGNGTRESHRGNGYGNPGDKMFTLNTTEQHAVADTKPVECLGVGFFQSTVDQSPSLLARDYKDPSIINRCSVVRRLTPDECAALQGFPRDWCNIGEWVDSKGKSHKDADSPKYKAYGNSIAIPFWYWLAQRICSQYDHQITIGSLFDGIGGFPLSFSRCGAAPVWASEIEEFAIAVTKKHFPE